MKANRKYLVQTRSEEENHRLSKRTHFVSVEQHHRWTSIWAINAEQKLTNEEPSFSGVVTRFAWLTTSTSGTDAFSLGSEGQ